MVVARRLCGGSEGGVAKRHTSTRSLFASQAQSPPAQHVRFRRRHTHTHTHTHTQSSAHHSSCSCPLATANMTAKGLRSSWGRRPVVRCHVSTPKKNTSEAAQMLPLKTSGAV